MLRALTREQREILVGLLRPRPLDKGETVFREGDVGDEMFLVESARLSSPDAAAIAARERRNSRR